MGERALIPDENSVVPFLKWAGGKRWLWKGYSNHFPSLINRYFEPFLGGGAVFLALQASAGRLSDTNSDLINSYKAIKKDWRSVESGLRIHQKLHCERHYYQVRTSRPVDPIERAVRFLYLNRTCWNGLYRVNLKGIFNVPKGTKASVILPNDNFEEMSHRLRQMSLLVCDFGEALRDVRSGDFVYIDPPYTVKHNVNGFLKYNEKIFSWHDQERLAACVRRLAHIGAKILVSQANHLSIRTLYKGMGDYYVVNRSSVIAAEPKRRGAVDELLIRINY